MATAAIKGLPQSAGKAVTTERLCMCATALLLVMQFSMIFTRAINWDEFFYYGQVSQFTAGELRVPLQTIHVHAFVWLTMLPGTVADHIVIARLAMLAFECASMACIVLMARRFTDDVTGWLAAICYLSAGYVLQHGMSFRVDPSLTACLMGAMCILLLAPLHWRALAAIAMLAGLAGMISIKTILFAPAFAGIAWLRWDEAGRDSRTAMRLASAGAGAIIAFALLYLSHAAAIAGPVAVEAAASGEGSKVGKQAARVVSRSASDMFFLGKPPYVAMIVKSASLAPLFAAFIITAPLFIWRAKAALATKLALFGLWLPILTLAFYRNTAGYYYAFVLAPLAVSCAPVVQWTRLRFDTALITAVLFGLAVLTFIKEDRIVLANQRAVLREVTAIVPPGTRYFDHSGMIPGLVKANGFMTPWGLEQYRRGGTATYRQAMEQTTIPLLIDNDVMIAETLADPGSTHLLPKDAAALRDNFVQYWGPIWLAGKSIVAGANKQEEVLVPGRYRISSGQLLVDGKKLSTGSTVELRRGLHRLVNPGHSDATLVWDELTRQTIDPAPDGALWIGY